MAQPGAKKLHPSIALLILAVIVAGIGFGINAQGVSCGGDQMSPGDVCVSDKGDRKTYTEVKANADNAPLQFGGAAGIIALGALVVAIRRRVKAGKVPQPENNSAA